MSKQYADSWLRWKREQMGLTLDEVADKANITRAALNRYEHGTRRPSSDVAEALAVALESDVSALFGSRPSPSTILNRVLEQWTLEDDPDMEIVPEDAFDRDMAWIDSEKGREARDRYYQRQEPRTYRPWVLELPDGRVVVEKPPSWFGAKMRPPQGAGKRKPRTRGKHTRHGQRKAKSRSSDSDDPGEPEPELGPEIHMVLGDEAGDATTLAGQVLYG